MSTPPAFKLSQLRERLKGEMKQQLFEDDNMFQRFLKARNYNIDAAETMLRNHINWRNKNKIDTMLTDFTPHKFLNTEYFTLNRLGHDPEDAPLYYLHFGGMDTRGVLKVVTKHDIEQYIAHFLETDIVAMKNTSQKTGNVVDQWVFTFNCENFSLATATHKPTLELFAGIALMYDANYPERLKSAYIFNASYYFMIFWAVIKTFLSPETVKKIKIFGKTGWKEEILKNIDPDVFPAFLGGNRTDPDGDPMCKTLIRFGGKVPEELFQFSYQPCASRLPGSKKLNISRMAKEEVKLQVPQPGSTIEWEFVVKSQDIAFSVIYKEISGGTAERVVPQQRIETVTASESGMFKCEKSGIYVLEFDNTYSWMHSKEIYYTASVVGPRTQTSSEEVK